MNDFFKELYVRVTLASPDFFIKLRGLFLSIASICTVLITSGVDFELFGINIPKVFTIFTAGAALMTYFGVKNPEHLEARMAEKK